jgi:ribosomal protein L37E
MRHMFNFKVYCINESKGQLEGKKIEDEPYFASTTEESLTNYYRCNRCGYMTNFFNEQVSNCPKCRNNEFNQISDFEYFADLKKNRTTKEFNDEMRKKKKREESFIDLNQLGNYETVRRYLKNVN